MSIEERFKKLLFQNKAVIVIEMPNGTREIFTKENDIFLRTLYLHDFLDEKINIEKVIRLIFTKANSKLVTIEF